jgi:hypothetical protein
MKGKDMIIPTKKLVVLLALGSCLTTNVFAKNTYSQNKKNHAHEDASTAMGPLSSREALTFSVGASYTYWVPYNEGTVFATGYGVDNSLPRNLENNQVGNNLVAEIGAVSGFKLRADVNTKHDRWHAAAHYTWFYHNPNFKASSVQEHAVYTTNILALLDSTFVRSAKSKYKVLFQRVDGMIDRNYYIGQYLVFKPWIGLLGAWDEQTINAEVVRFQEDSDTTTFYTNTSQNFWGVGPYAGMTGTFYFNHHVGVFISTGTALLLSNRKITTDYLSIGATDVLGYIGRNASDNNDVEPMLEISLGICWESFWEKAALRIDLAWEAQTYLEHYSYLELYASKPTLTNYSMQGLTLGATISF